MLGMSSDHLGVAGDEAVGVAGSGRFYVASRNVGWISVSGLRGYPRCRERSGAHQIVPCGRTAGFGGDPVNEERRRASHTTALASSKSNQGVAECNHTPGRRQGGWL